MNRCTLAVFAALPLVIACPRSLVVCAAEPADAAVQRNMRIAPLEPADAPKSFFTLAGFRMDLIAAEPLVADPVAMAYDEDGRAWVVEMIDYPYVDKAGDVAWQEQKQPALGQVRVLEDVDGDGNFDRSTVFAEGLSWPSGIALYAGGAFVTATPDVWYLKDTDGDGRADVRRKVFSGFRKFNVQAVINNLVWGLDHQIYGAGSSNGGQIESANGQKQVVLARNDFCFDPREQRFELLSGGARFGNTFDDWGNRFVCSIYNPAQHVVLPARYLARNPYLRVASALQDVAAAGDAVPVYARSRPEPWRVINAERLAAAGDPRTPRASTVAGGYITSASGATIYRGAAYGPQYYGNLVLGEVAGNLVHREVVQAVGVTFRSHRAAEEEKCEFVASSDNWFRPVNFVNAPDGTLHVLDMYRETIEHPWSMPDDLKQLVDLRSGSDRGRIYRLSPPGFRPPAPPRLGRATTVELVGLLVHADGWWRDTAHRLLFERQDPGAVAPLRALLRTGKSPLARLHALWSLQGLTALDRDDLLQALADDSPGVREHAISLAEPRLEKDVSLRERVVALASDAAPRIRFQAALSLGNLQDPGATRALAAILRQDAADPWMRAAVLSGRPGLAGPLLVDLCGDAAWRAEPAAAALARDLAMIAGAARDAKHAAQLLDQLADIDLSGPQRLVRLSALVGLGEGARGQRVDWLSWARNDAARQAVHETLSAASVTALDNTAPLADRQLALAALTLAGWQEVRGTFESLLDPRQPREIQLAAVRNLVNFADPQAAAAVLAHWQGYTPALRGVVVEALLSRTEYLDPLFSAMERGEVPTTYVNAPRRLLLLKHPQESIRNRAAQIFQQPRQSRRQEIVARLQPALELAGDPLNGLRVYQRECAACHRLRNQGHEVGPNLATIRHRSPAELLIAILDPNREVGPNFLQYIAVLDDGRSSSGMIVSETPASVTLRRAEMQEEILLRENIDTLVGTGLSMMPEGFEQKLTPQEIADLIAALRAN